MSGMAGNAGANRVLQDAVGPAAASPAAMEKWRLNPQVVFRRLGDEMVLVHLDTDRIYRLNAVGARVWELIAGGLSRGEILGTLLQEFAVTEARLVQDMELVFTLLAQEDLIIGDEPG